MQVIGVTGFRRCGKNSTTSILARLFGFKQYAFADALRTMTAAVDPVISLHGTPESIMAAIGGQFGIFRKEYRYNELIDALGYERAKEIPDFRRFLQKLGTEGVRSIFGPNAWVDALARRIQLDGEERITISDVRFRSEANWVHDQGGVLWRVVRPGVGGDDPHPSEVEIPHLPADREIVATSLDELERSVANAAQVDLRRIIPTPTTISDAHTS